MSVKLNQMQKHHVTQLVHVDRLIVVVDDVLTQDLGLHEAIVHVLVQIYLKMLMCVDSN